jgi:mono/diheme cytochrome c family protein
MKRLWILAIMAFFATGCGFLTKDRLATSSRSSSVRIIDPALNQKAITILARCLGCHAEVGSVDRLVASGWIVPGNSQASSLMVRTKDGTMPPGAPLAASDLTTLESWIRTGLAVDAGAPPPPGTSAPAGSSAIAQRAFTILRTYCASCHGPGSAGDGGIDYVLDFERLIATNQAIPGNASGSPIYQDIATGTMPPAARLSASDTQALYDWIQSDLKAGTPQPAPSLIPLDKTFTSISANILVPKCTGCHGAINPKDGISYASYSATLRTLRIGSPSESRLYQSCAQGEMPPGPNRLSTAELRAISEWIADGALEN